MNKRAESGQAILIMALAMVVLIAVMGLAIDGGGLLLLRRDTQNAVDAALMAGAYAICTSGDVVQAAESAAAANGFTTDAKTAVVITYPGHNAAGMVDDHFVDVMISREKEKYFIQVVYAGKLEARSTGVAYCNKGANVYADKALFAMDQDCPTNKNVVALNGASLYIEGGIFSNGDLNTGGSSSGMQVIGGVEYVGTHTGADKLNTTPNVNNPLQVPAADDFPLLYTWNAFVPAAYTSPAIHQNGEYYEWAAARNQFTYHNGDWRPVNETISGLHVVNGNVNIRQAIPDPVQGITIVATGTIEDGGGGQKSNPTAWQPYLPSRLLFFSLDSDACGGGADGVNIAGNYTDLNGLIYVPFSAVSFSAANATLVGAIIADVIELSGADKRVIYDPRVIPPDPPKIAIAD